MKQRFNRGDIVRVASDAPWIRSGGKVIAFKTGAGEEAVVIGSYKDQFGGGERERHTYTLAFRRHGQISWYDDNILTLVRKGATDPVKLFLKGSQDD